MESFETNKLSTEGQRAWRGATDLAHTPDALPIAEKYVQEGGLSELQSGRNIG